MCCRLAGVGVVMNERIRRKSLMVRGRVLFCPLGAALKLSCSSISILLKEEGTRHLLSTDCVSDPVL